MDSTSRALPAAIACAVAFCLVLAFGAWLRGEGGAPLPVDLWWRGLVGLDRGSPLLPVALVLRRAGSALGVGICVTAVATALLAMRRWREACSIVTAALAGVFASEAVKAWVSRPRPLEALTVEHGFSFPSGHSMGAAMLSVSVALVIASGRGSASPIARWAWLGAGAWTLAMMWSRAALQVHWLTDTLAGGLLGAAVAILAAMLCRGPRLERSGDTPRKMVE